MGRFDGKTALVTGAGSGIGRAIAARLAADGARVILTDVNGAQDAAAREIGGLALARRLDVADQANVADLERWIGSEFGGLDILANNAGIGGPNLPIHEYPVDAFDRVVAVNIRVNAVAPGTTRTAILDEATPDLMRMLEGRIPQGRLGTPEEIANVAAFLADDSQASHVTGQIWVVDGGRSAG